MPCGKLSWCHAACCHGAMRPVVMVPCGLLSWCHVACCHGAMWPVVMVPCGLLSWCHAACCHGAMWPVVMVPCGLLSWCHVACCHGAMWPVVMVPCGLLSWCHVACCHGAMWHVVVSKVQTWDTSCGIEGVLNLALSWLLTTNAGNFNSSKANGKPYQWECFPIEPVECFQLESECGHFLYEVSLTYCAMIRECPTHLLVKLCY